MLPGIVGCVVPHRRVVAAAFAFVIVGCAQDVEDGVFSSATQTATVSVGVATNASGDESDTGRDGSTTADSPEGPMDTAEDGMSGPVEDSSTSGASADDTNPTFGPLDGTESSGATDPQDPTLDDGMMDDGALPGGDCCVAHGGLGCDDPAVEACVCALDDVCCSAGWDEICVEEAGQCGAACMGGGGDAGDCCVPHLTPGCSNLEIEGCVCSFDDFCCSTEWDEICVDEVFECGVAC